MAEKKSWQEWKTTIFGVITLVVGMLVAFGVITPEQQGDLNTHVMSLGEVISGAVIAISGIINVFRAK
jgi:fumarate reductase subunit D